MDRANTSLEIQWGFGPFRLDPNTACLWREDQLLPLQPKPLAVLAHLVAHAGQVVTKEALLDAVWPETAVTEGVLKTAIREVRQVLDETARKPRYIATVHRRGYRFVAPVSRIETAAVELGSVPLRGGQAHRPVVARETELMQLQQGLARTGEGERQLIFITGEAGIGKTTLADIFVEQLSEPSGICMGRGQCIEHYGIGEPYLPLLEALSRACRGPESTLLVDTMRQYAPSWLLQLPGIVPESELASLERRTRGVTRERMLRELAEAVEMFSAQQPFVLVLEDLHWSDGSTLDWLVYMARRRDPARLLILGTYRPVEAIIHAHPIHKAAQELQLQNRCSELVLDYLTEADVDTYLAQRFGNLSQRAQLTRALHWRTTGNPLFLSTLVDELVHQGGVHATANGWALTDAADALMTGLPENLRQLLEQQLTQLDRHDRQLLEVASVAGIDFTAATVAAVTKDSETEVEARCATLARQRQFLQERGATAWPDGTVSACYGFIHALYQEVLYDRVTASQRIRWHREIAAHLEAAYGQQTHEIAAELAMHQQLPKGLEPQ